MPNTTISVSFPAYKLQALNLALEEKGEKTVEILMQEHVETLYMKSVPAVARTFLDKMMGETPAVQAAQEQEEATALATPEPENQRRQYRRRNAPAEQENVQAPALAEQPEQAPAEEESQGMTMSM